MANQKMSEALRTLADVIEGTDIDDGRSAHLTFRMDEDASRNTDLPISDVNDPYNGTVQCDIDISDGELITFD